MVPTSPTTSNMVLLTLELLLDKHDSGGAMGRTFQGTLLEVKQKGRMTLEKLILSEEFYILLIANIYIYI